MKTPLVWLAIPLSVCVLVGSTRAARADDGTGQVPNVTKERVETTGPNRALLHSGVWIFVLSYVPAVIVAAESNRHGDKNLYVPIAGPWMDLAARDRCPSNGSCKSDTLNKVLIVVDGIFQGLAALDIVGALLFPETRTTTISSSNPDASRPALPLVRILPAQFAANGYGVAAVGTF